MLLLLQNLQSQKIPFISPKIGVGKEKEKKESKKMESLIELRIQNLLLKVGVSFVAVLMIYGLGVTAAHEDFHVHSPHDHDHHCGHGHLHHHHHHHHNEGEHHHGRHDDVGGEVKGRRKLPEELAEEEDLKLYGFGVGDHHQHHHHGIAAGDEELSGLGKFLLLAL